MRFTLPGERTRSGFWEKFFFKPGNLGYPVFQTKYAKVGVYICYDRHFPDGARCLGLDGAEIVYNPSATTVGQSQYLWKLEQPAHAVANGYFMGCINRVGEEKPWNLGKFYGSSYFVDPRGQIFAQASEDKDELLVAEFDLDMIEEVRSVWQFFRDRRPETPPLTHHTTTWETMSGSREAAIKVTRAPDDLVHELLATMTARVRSSA